MFAFTVALGPVLVQTQDPKTYGLGGKKNGNPSTLNPKLIYPKPYKRFIAWFFDTTFGSQGCPSSNLRQAVPA